MTVGERIKQKREELGLSQGDLAKLMCVSRQAISKAELHDNNITTDKVRKFAKALGVTEAYLMGWGTESTREKYFSYRNEIEMSLLSNDEIDLIKQWRSADEETRKMIARILAYESTNP